MFARVALTFAALLAFASPTHSEEPSSARNFIVSVSMKRDGQEVQSARTLIRENDGALIISETGAEGYQLDLLLNAANGDAGSLTLEASLNDKDLGEVASPRLTFLPSKTALVRMSAGKWDEVALSIAPAK